MVCADAFVGMGVTVGEGGVVGARAAEFKDVTPWTVWGGCEEIAEAVKEFLSKEKPIEACRKRVVDCYDKNDRYQEYVELYEKLLK